MRAVLDTNVVASALLWGGTPERLIEAAGKTRITIRLDDAILEWFRKRVHAACGGSYQTRINRAGQQHIARDGERATPRHCGVL